MGKVKINVPSNHYTLGYTSDFSYIGSGETGTAAVYLEKQSNSWCPEHHEFCAYPGNRCTIIEVPTGHMPYTEWRFTFVGPTCSGGHQQWAGLCYMDPLTGECSPWTYGMSVCTSPEEN